MDRYKDRCVAQRVNPKTKFKYNRLTREIALLDNLIRNINLEIVHLMNHSIIEIAKYYKTDLISMEDLRWSRHQKKRERGRYLSFWQTHWLHGQIEQAIELQTCINGIEFTRVNAWKTSQKCSECGTMDESFVGRDRKRFVCTNYIYHKSKKEFRLDADLNAARNIAIQAIELTS